jgi:tubulin epsilon
VLRFTCSVFPSEDDDVVTSPYNSLLALDRLLDSAHCVFPVENQALADICARAEQQQQQQQLGRHDGRGEGAAIGGGSGRGGGRGWGGVGGGLLPV